MSIQDEKTILCIVRSVLVFGLIGTANVALGDDIGIVAEQNNAVLDGSAVPDVVTNDALLAVLDDDAVVRAPNAYAAVVASETEGIAGEHDIVSLRHADVRTVIFLVERNRLGFTGAIDQIARDGNGSCIAVIPAENQSRTAGAVEIVAGEVTAVDVRQIKAGQTVPFHAVARRRNRRATGAALDTAVAVAGEPVIYDKAVPAVDIQTCIREAEHGVTDGETPDVLQMDGVSREVADAAVIDGWSVLLGTAVVLIPVQLDAVNTFTEVLTA